jgi:hypothetical protein
MTLCCRPVTLARVETSRCLAPGQPTGWKAKGGHRMGIIEIVVIVLIVLLVIGYFGRGRFRA